MEPRREVDHQRRSLSNCNQVEETDRRMEKRVVVTKENFSVLPSLFSGLSLVTFPVRQ